MHLKSGCFAEILISSLKLLLAPLQALVLLLSQPLKTSLIHFARAATLKLKAIDSEPMPTKIDLYTWCLRWLAALRAAVSATWRASLRGDETHAGYNRGQP